MNGHPDIEAGKVWVETKIREFSASISNPPRALVWQQPEQRTKEQFARGSIGLKLYWGEDFRIVEFLETELQDVEATPEIQICLSDRIRNKIQQYK